MMSAMECVEVASSCEEREIELEKVGDDPLSLTGLRHRRPNHHLIFFGVSLGRALVWSFLLYHQGKAPMLRLLASTSWNLASCVRITIYYLMLLIDLVEN
jgi:predicted alpha/beta-fold hydrolase